MQCSAQNSSALTRDEFLAAMCQIANSVAIVTTNGPHGKHGATVSSFCSVSADPPSMLVCLNANSRIAECVKNNGIFCINVLSQEMMDVADRFAGRQDETGMDRFEGIDHVDSSDASPSISKAVSFHCVLESDHLSGSHRVAIGNVVQIDGNIKRPLTYMDGQYRPWLI